MKLYLALFFLFGALHVSAQNRYSFDFEEASGSTVTLDSISGVNYQVSNHFNSPERPIGISGNCLRLDGFSTFVNLGSNNLDSALKELSISLYYATEAFTQDGGALVSRKASTAGFELKVSSFGKVQFLFTTNSGPFTLESQTQLIPYSWYKLGVDVNINSGYAKLYINGSVEDSLTISTSSNLIYPTGTSLLIGRSSQNQTTYGFSTVTANGAIDEIRIRNQSEQNLYYSILPSNNLNARSALLIDPDQRHSGDHLRPQYHPMPNTSWANESYGLTHFNGQYHMFFQKNPSAPGLFFMHWGHLVSSDLVHWEEVEIPLAPSPGWDDWGIWSGTTAFDTSGLPVIYYTGVNGQKAGIGRAFAKDSSLLMWEKDVTNPLISNPPPSYNHMDFRDPYVFEYNGYYYMIIGSGLAGNGGGILFSYRSTDMKNWNFILPIFQHSNVADLGTFWEMAYMFEIRQDTFLFGVGPLGMPKVRALYSLGTFVNNKFVPFVPASEFKDIELVEHNLLAPAFGKDEWGQYVYSGILAEQRSVTDQIAAGWRHTFSLPRRVFICDDGKTLGQYPHPNLCSLRDTLNKVSINNVNISNSQNFIDKDWASQQYEFEGYITNESNGYVVLEFLKDTLSQKSVKLELDFIQNRVVLNRQNSSPYNATQDVQIADYIFANNDSVYLRVFIDHSTIEIFLDNVAVMSARVYPHPAQNQFLIKCLSGSVRVSGSLFPMFGMRDTVNRYTTYCEPTNVPTGYYGYISSGELGDDPQIVLMPNPSLEVLKVRCPVTEDCQYVIYNGQSKIVQRGVFLKEISVEGLPAGSYYLKLSCSEQVLKFIKL